MTPTNDPDMATQGLQRQAGEAAATVAAQGRNFAKRQKNAAADELQVVGDALCRVADEMQQNEEATVVHLAGTAGQQLRELGEQLRRKDVPTLMRDASDYARRSPGTFFAGTLIAGFLLARFMKSSQQPERSQAGNGHADGRAHELPVLQDEPPMQGERYAH